MTGRWRLICGVLLIATGVALIATAEAQGDDSVTPMCNGQPCAGGWYTSSVFLSWSWSGGTATPGTCSSQDYLSDTLQTASCTVSFSDGTGSVTRNYILRVETSNPTVTATPLRPADSNGWYNHPVAVAFAGSSFSGIASCSPTATYGGPNAINSAVAGGCTDNAGKSVNASVALNYDATPPKMTGVVPSRRPDFNGWYSHPISFRFIGTDPFSGIERCSTVTYSGPTAGAGSVVGSCIDEAGNVATLAVPLRYSATPPPLNAHISAGDRTVTLRWQKTSGLSSFTISRSPGLYGQRTSVVARGGPGAFTDTRVQNGVRYSYTIRVRDRKGHVAARTVHAMPGIRLLSPLPGSQLGGPPLLRWTAVVGASYYNVQLFRGGDKILSTWPASASLRLSRSWSFRNSRFRLTPGRYRWYVWPGFGPRAAGRYGPMIGTGTFTAVAPR
jgi:hypothetical protein